MCNMLRRLTHFVALWDLAGVATDCRVDPSRNVVGVKRAIFWQAIASYPLTSVLVSGKLLEVHVVDQGADKLGASPFFSCS